MGLYSCQLFTMKIYSSGTATITRIELMLSSLVGSLTMTRLSNISLLRNLEIIIESLLTPAFFERMHSANLRLAEQLVTPGYIKLAENSINARENILKELLSQRQLPEEGLDQLTIEHMLNQLGTSSR